MCTQRELVSRFFQPHISLFPRAANLARHWAKVRIRDDFDFFSSEFWLGTDKNIIKQEDSRKKFPDIRLRCHPKSHFSRLVADRGQTVALRDKNRAVDMEWLGNDRETVQSKNIVRPENAVERPYPGIIQVHPLPRNPKFQEGFLHRDRLIVIEGGIVTAKKQTIHFFRIVEPFRSKDALLVKHVRLAVRRVFGSPEHEPHLVFGDEIRILVPGGIHGDADPDIHEDREEQQEGHEHQKSSRGPRNVLPFRTKKI